MARPAEEAQTAWCRRACTIIAPLARAREKESQALSLSLGASSLDAILASSLDEILSIPWVTLESKGSFFLVDPEDAGSLLLTTHRGLASPLLASCARVPLGRCMCGRAAASRTIVFADRVDDRHDITYDGMGPHGHYCIPVLIENRLLGVLNLYVKEGYARNPQDDTFLTAMASALALCIDRKKKDEELLRSVARLRAAMDGVVSVLARTLESRDPYTAGHQRRVASIAAAVAVEMGLPESRVEGIRIAGIVHDLGKIAVPAEILSKPTRLNPAEMSLVQAHSQVGFDILKDIEFPWAIAESVLQHHERMDGSGYPRGLKGDQILLDARILAVADVVEAMASHRPYRASLGLEKALEEIEARKGSVYDPEVATACLRLFRVRGYQIPA